MLLTNGHLLTMDGPAIPGGWLRLEGGRIAALGAMDCCPAPAAGEEVLDLSGRFLCPGFVDAHCHLGMFGDSLGFEGEDGNEDTDPVTPQLRAIDGVNPLDRCFREAREAGVTTVLTGPGSANPIGGQFAAMKTDGRRVDDMLLAAPACVKFALGENPKFVYHEKEESPVTRMATAALIRETLFKAREYLEKQERAKAEQEDGPDFDLKLESLLPLLRREVPAHFHAHRADDILTAVRIAREFDLDFAIVHGTEAHLIADILAAEGVPVIAGPMLNDRSKPELRSLTERAPALLAEAGIPFCICSDHPETPIQHLALSAMLAARSGLNKDRALATITSEAARLVGLQDRVGRLAAGLDGDLLVFDGHPLSLESRLEQVFLNGKRI